MSWTCPSCQQENPETAHFCSACGAPDPGEASRAAAPPSEVPPPVVPPRPHVEPAKGGSGKKIFLFLGLGALLLFCCIAAGIVAAIAIPNFIQAKEKGRQKKAVAEVQQVATAIQAYAQDNGGLYPDTGHEPTMVYTTVDLDKLAGFLVPKYIPVLPAKDPWEIPYQYGVNSDDSAFILISTGKGGTLSLEAVPEAPEETHCYQDDILWENDRFLRSPGGSQKDCP